MREELGCEVICRKSGRHRPQHRSLHRSLLWKHQKRVSFLGPPISFLLCKCRQAPSTSLRTNSYTHTELFCRANFPTSCSIRRMARNFFANLNYCLCVICGFGKLKLFMENKIMLPVLPFSASLQQAVCLIVCVCFKMDVNHCTLEVKAKASRKLSDRTEAIFTPRSSTHTRPHTQLGLKNWPTLSPCAAPPCRQADKT